MNRKEEIKQMFSQLNAVLAAEGPVTKAVRAEDANALKAALAAGGDSNESGPADFRPPLALALMARRVDLANELLAAGANPNAKAGRIPVAAFARPWCSKADDKELRAEQDIAECLFHFAACEALTKAGADLSAPGLYGLSLSDEFDDAIGAMPAAAVKAASDTAGLKKSPKPR